MMRAVAEIESGRLGNRSIPQEPAGLGQFNGGCVERQAKRGDGLAGALICSAIWRA
ncbi:uncharacterized protein METZ01_LOCUS486289 [marine metagenome]|uniref:Uncharacterized protein n=1 Tax=marine metagenome TaxID=408172 RepID=A0A383CNR8_9ZZZZ